MNRTSKGVILPVVLLVLIILGGLAMVMSLKGVQEAGGVQRQVYRTQAFWIAEAGIHHAYWEVANHSCQGMKDLATNADCFNCSCLGGDMVLAGLLNGGSYSVVASNSGMHLDSTGSYAPNDHTPAFTRRITLDLMRQSFFGYAAFAKGEMTFNNNALVDSYDSSQGAYGGVNIGTTGNIGTNGGAVNIITLGENVTIKGSVSTGQGGTVSLGSGATVTGTITHTNNVVLSSVVVPADLANAALLPAVSLGNNQSKTYTTGDYKIPQITFSNGNEIIVDGDVRWYFTGDPGIISGNNGKVTIRKREPPLPPSSLTIYTDGKIEFDNNVLLNNETMDPTKFMIFSTYSGDDGIVIMNNGHFYGAVYAPNAGIRLENNAAVFGAMVGSQVSVANNDQIHYDKALASIIDSNIAPSIYNWNEM